jgi:hypothetical protein
MRNEQRAREAARLGCGTTVFRLGGDNLQRTRVGSGHASSVLVDSIENDQSKADEEETHESDRI